VSDDAGLSRNRPRYVYGAGVPARRIRLLYHVAKESNLPSILARGLEPRCGEYKNNVWIGCIFLVRRRRDADAMVRTLWGDRLAGYDASRFDHTRMTILTIDPRRIVPRAEFYVDQALVDLQIPGVFTPSAIGPNAIVRNERWKWDE
jgi:hypothetical protein